MQGNAHYKVYSVLEEVKPDVGVAIATIGNSWWQAYTYHQYAALPPAYSINNNSSISIAGYCLQLSPSIYCLATKLAPPISILPTITSINIASYS